MDIKVTFIIACLALQANRFSVVGYNGTSIENPKSAFPCPEPEDIAPCVCKVENEVELHLYCSYITSEEELNNVFQQNFPVKNFYEFYIYDSNALERLEGNTNGVTFERIWFYPGPFTLNYISPNYFLGSADTLYFFYLHNSELTSKGFPFDSLASYSKLSFLSLRNASFTSVSPITSSSLTQLYIDFSDIGSIEPGTFDNCPRLSKLIVNHNKIETLKTGSLPVFFNMSDILIGENLITSIESGTFFDGTSNGQPGVESIAIYNNNIPVLGRGTIPFTSTSQSFELNNNGISVIEPGAFFFMGEPQRDTVYLRLSSNDIPIVDEAVFGHLMDYINILDMQFNPLECGCDVAWIVTNSTLKHKMKLVTRCADGTDFNTLDPNIYAEFC